MNNGFDTAGREKKRKDRYDSRIRDVPVTGRRTRSEERMRVRRRRDGMAGASTPDCMTQWSCDTPLQIGLMSTCQAC